MKSYVTSYSGLFSQRADAPVIERIEVPIIQRDYAQGRDTDAVVRIRASFLDALHHAVTTGTAISLDFVYGDVVSGTFHPLDGQQRLTTLFLLHWYLAWRANQLEQQQGWKRFQYATRPSARRFCECLVASNPPSGANLRKHFEDQHWFLHTWQYDPTINSMLVMLQAIDERFAEADCLTAWERLVDPERPAVSFHLLPMEEIGAGQDLYIKMNSRGKPLTEFENFKARFEQLLELSCPNRVEEFKQKVDGKWADVLWVFRGSNNVVDDEFLRYFQFITDICEWHFGLLPVGDVETMAERVYGAGNEHAATHLDFLVHCFDTWVDVDIESVFAAAFSHTPAPVETEDTSKVVLFGRLGSTVNLFADCCLGRVRRSWQSTLLLYAVLVHRLYNTNEFPRRLRILRNLIEASGSELRAERMPGLLLDARKIIVDGGLQGVSSFNQAQVADEKLKLEFLSGTPNLAGDLFHLEDHPLLRGCVMAFELDAVVFERRARAFHRLFADPNLLPVLPGALLAAGDYSRRIGDRFLQFGSGFDSAQWREAVLTGSTRTQLVAVRAALGRLLDEMADEGDLRAALRAFTAEWLQTAAGTGRDWRWYFVRYSEMRAGHSGIYARAPGALGYSVCMLDKKAVSSYYRDAYLSAIRKESGVADVAVQGDVWPDVAGGPWFTGYETEDRWMRLTASGAALLCVHDGLLLRAPSALSDPLI